jgi:small subunit ribosomal protein S8
MMTDPIADMLTRIRNANQLKHEKVDIPLSRIKLEIVKILKEEGYIKGYKLIKESNKSTIRIIMRYLNDSERTITGLKRISKPSRRVYVKKDNLPLVLNGIGLAIISTSQKILTDKHCREKGIGGEVLCYVW